MQVEEKIKALLERWAYVQNGEQMQTMNVNEVDGLVTELAELVRAEKRAA